MKIISWNCQGAFRKKNDLVLRLNPDLVIVTECENPQRLKFGELTPTPLSYYWYGSNQNKGIAILSYSDYKVEVLDAFNPAFRYVIPIRCESKINSFLLFAIWAMEDKDNRRRSYVGQIWEAINHYAHLLNGDTVLVGDFNSNSIWDLKSRVGNHSDVVHTALALEVSVGLEPTTRTLTGCRSTIELGNQIKELGINEHYGSISPSPP